MDYTIQIALDALSLGSFYALTAVGIGLLFGVLRQINFAHGGFITVGAYALIVPTTAAQATLFIGALNPFLLILGVVSAVVILALISEFTVFRPLRNSPPATMMIGSFALSFIIQNLIIMLYSSRPKSVDIWPKLNKGIVIYGRAEVPLLQIIVIAVTIIAMVLLVLFLTRSRYGLFMRASAEDVLMARMLGIKAALVQAIAVVISGILAAVVSLLFLVQTGMLSYQMGISLMLFAFISTVIGGIGSLIGAVLGGYLVGVASSLMQVFLPSDMRSFRDVFVFLFVILILLARPQGLFRSSKTRERV
jgi:branched-chain amino acid transport system permease protein